VNYQKLILGGNATEDARRRKSRQGDVTFTTFSVGVRDGKDHTIFFPVVVFGDYGKTVARYVTKGRQVLVDGRVRVNDKGRFHVVADSVRFGNEPSTTDDSE
jgi:single-strand DNA-binding protein